MTWLTGSQVVEPGRTSSRVGSESPAPAGEDENDTYPLSGVCLLRVAVFTAVMICRVMQSSAKLRKLDSRSGGKPRMPLWSPTGPLLMGVSLSPPTRKYDEAFSRTKEW